MVFGARVYLQADEKTVMVFQMKKDVASPEYFVDSLEYKTANRDDVEAIGRLVQAALDGTLNQ